MAHDSIKILLDSLERSGTRRFSHSELARALNVSEQVITNWAKRGISADGALAAQFAFHMDANYILGRVSHPMMVPRRDDARPHMVMEDAAPYAIAHPWPFEVVTPAQWGALDMVSRRLVEAVALRMTPS